MRIAAACGSLAVVAFYLIAQMVGAGKLIRLLFGLPYELAVVIVGAVMIAYVLFGGMMATTWVQIIKAVLLLGGASSWRSWCWRSSASARTRMFDAAAVKYGDSRCLSPGRPGGQPAGTPCRWAWR